MKKKRKITIFEIIAILFFIFVVVILLLPSPQHPLKDSRTPAPTNSAESSRSLEDMQGFMDTHLATILMETLPKRQFRFPEIQERYDLLAQKIQQQYGKGYVLNPVGKYHPSSKLVSMAAGIENRNPTITLSMPSVMDMWEAWRTLGLREDSIEVLVVVDLLHELDHLAGGGLPDGGTSYPFEKWIENETRTWGETCEYTLRPLIEMYKEPLSPREQTYYQMWVRSKRNADSPVWKNFIRGQYEKVHF